MKRQRRIANGTEVAFDIGQGLAVGRATIVDAKYDDGWLYRLDAIEASQETSNQLNSDGEFWVCDFEIKPAT